MKEKHTSAATSHGNENSRQTNRSASRKGGKHEANLRKNSFVNFQIGLIVAMLMVYIGLEAAFTVKKEMAQLTEDPLDETFIFETPPPVFTIEKEKVVEVQRKKVLNPAKIEIAPDDANLEPKVEQFIDMEPEGNVPDLNISDLTYEKEPVEDPKVPFITVEEVPVFPGCEKVAKDQKRVCFQEKMTKHIKRNIKYPEIDQELGIGGRVNMVFTIGVDGSITAIQMRGPSKTLEAEAKRIIDKLPKMTPGKQRGEAVKVSFSQPIFFSRN